MKIEINQLDKAFGEQIIFKAFDLTIPAEKITGISGPSGCGKTTLLKMIAGLIKVDSGEIKGADPASISYIFQEPRLIPWRTVRENLRFVLKTSQTRRAGVDDDRINAMLSLVGLAEVGTYFPDQLSGGMRQRVAMARAFLYPSQLLLMDEPFSSLDQALKDQLMEAFLNIWESDRRTVIFVSHDEDEIRGLSHQILRFSQKPVRLLKREDGLLGL